MKLLHRVIALASVTILIFTAGCSNASSPASTTAPPEVPQVTAAKAKVAPPPASNFVGYSLKIKPAQGPTVILQEPVAAQLIMDASSTDRLQAQKPEGKFDNRIDLIGPDGKSKYAFSLSSDGQMILKSLGSGKQAFYMPEYVYYLIESSLWNYSGSLMDEPLKWQPTAGAAALELQLPRLLKSSLIAGFGYSLAYFTSYKIYGVDTSTRNTVRVYLLVTYAGYDVQGTKFAPNFLFTSPITLVFIKTTGNYWSLTELKQPSGIKFTYTTVRTIFSYDYMDAVMTDLKDPSFQTKDIASLATEYLQQMGISGLTVQ
jgi:hypothetical protein